MTLAGLSLSLAPDAPAVSLTLAKAQAMLGCTGCVVNAETIDIGDGTNRVRFFPGRRRTEVNGSTVWLNAIAEPAGTSDLLKLDARDVREVLRPLLRPPPAPEHPLRVMLDPGHGGEDSGAVSARPAIEEKDLVLDLALRIGKLLEEAGLVVGYTRRDDTFLSLDERTATASVWRADAFVSLHANFADNRQASGPETYVLPFAGYAPTGGDQRISSKTRNGNRHDIGNTLLGHSIHRRLPGRRGECDRGLRRARFQVLRQAGCPAVLVEVGFLSNAVEARLLASGWFRGKLARAVADGILDYARPPKKDEGYLPGIEALLTAPVVTEETPAVAGALPDAPAVTEETPAMAGALPDAPAVAAEASADVEVPVATAVAAEAPAAIEAPAVTAAVEEATAAIGAPAVTAAVEEATAAIGAPAVTAAVEEATAAIGTPAVTAAVEEVSVEVPVVGEEPADDVAEPVVPAAVEEVPADAEVPTAPAVPGLEDKDVDEDEDENHPASYPVAFDKA
jgi:N-acetylmuramoyl-L-alanine amidase